MTHHHIVHSFAPLLAWVTWGSAWMLMWGGAALIPIVLHFWYRRTRRDMHWAAMQFLQAAVQKHARRTRLEQLLLLLIRVATLVLLAVALANPLWTAVSPSTVDSSAYFSVLVIDASYSMRFRDGETTRFEAAQEKLRQYVRECAAGHRFALVAMADPPSVIVDLPGLRGDEILREIDALTPTCGGADLVSALGELTRMHAVEDDRASSSPTSRIILITDLGDTTWGAARTQEALTLLDALAVQADLQLIDVAHDGARNAAIANVRSRATWGLINRPLRLSASIFNFSDQPSRARFVSLYVDNQLVGQQTVELPAGEASDVEFECSFPTLGDHRIRVQLDEDALPIDDQRYGVITIRDAVRVLCVNGQPDAGKFVGLALNPSSADGAAIDVQQVGESPLLDLDLQAYDAVFLCHVDRFRAAEQALLAEFLHRGGGLIVVPGGADIDNYNRLLGPILPGLMGMPVRSGNHRFDPRDYRHPLVDPFRGFPDAGLTTTPVRGYYRVVPHRDARVALWYGTGDPAILDRPVARGRCVLLTTPVAPVPLDKRSDAGQTWNDWHMWPSFPPLVQQTLQVAITAATDLRQTLVNAPLLDDIQAPPGDLFVQLVGPGGAGPPMMALNNGGIFDLQLPGCAAPGLYELSTEPPLPGKRWFAVNVDTKESNLARTPLTELPSSLVPSANSAANAPERTLSNTAPRRLFRWFLAAVCVLILGESWWAMRLGRNAA